MRTEAQFRVIWYRGHVYLQKRVAHYWENVKEESPDMPKKERLN